MPIKNNLYCFAGLAYKAFQNGILQFAEGGVLESMLRVKRHSIITVNKISVEHFTMI
jgi:hypothetical protein